MNDQLSMFDAQAATEQRDEAIERVEAHADPDWLDLAYKAIEKLARERAYVTTDGVWDELAKHELTPNLEPRALGAVMKRAAKAGLIKGTSIYVTSKRPVCHGRQIRTWESVR